MTSNNKKRKEKKLRGIPIFVFVVNLYGLNVVYTRNYTIGNRLKVYLFIQKKSSKLSCVHIN